MSARLSVPEPVDSPGEERAEASVRPLARRIEALRAAGAAQWDGPAFSLLVALYARAERGGPSAARTLAWALDRCEALERWMEDATPTLAALAGSTDEVREAIEHHDLATALVVAALAALPQPTARALQSAAGPSYGERLEESLLEARTAVVSAQAHAAGAEPSGPYNPTALAGKLLAAIDDLAPDYLRACVAAFHDLAALQQAASDAASSKPRRSRPPRSSRAPARIKNE